MALRLLPWSPEYGSGLQAEPESDAAGSATTVDATIEGAWEPRAPSGDAPRAVQIVDGVRRVEAHAIEDLPGGEAAYGLFGSYAVGVVRCEDGRARILDGPRELRVQRRYLQTGGSELGEAVDRIVVAGQARLRFVAELPARAASPNDLVAALNRLMLDEEAKLAEELSEDETTLTIVDGPLRLRAPGKRVVGYVKRTHRWYLGPTELALLPDLEVGARTPLFRVSEDPLSERDPHGARERIAWYLRIADLGRHFHHLAGIVRLEVPGGVPVPEAARLADQSALVLPRFASSPVRDPRAPQNLTPVGALEDVLTRRLGDRRWLRRQIAAALGGGDRAEVLAATTTHAGV